MILAPKVLWATGQHLDVIVYRGQERGLFPFPLQSFYKDDKSRPRFRTDPNVLLSSANNRGYVATWEVKDGFLYLIKIDAWICENFGPEETCKKADLKEMFGERCQGGKVKADWFSGELVLSDGKLLYSFGGDRAVYEKYVILKVTSGKITGEKVINNTKKKTIGLIRKLIAV